MQAFGILLHLWIWALVLRVLKHGVALPRLVGMAHAHPRGAASSAEFEARLATYLQRRDRFPFRAPGNCLERSLGAYRLLCARGRRPELKVGVARSPGNGVRGHIWLELDGRPFGERTGDLEGLTPIVTFDADGRQRSTGGFAGELSRIRIP